MELWATCRPRDPVLSRSAGLSLSVARAPCPGPQVSARTPAQCTTAFLQQIHNSETSARLLSDSSQYFHVGFSPLLRTAAQRMEETHPRPPTCGAELGLEPQSPNSQHSPAAWGEHLETFLSPSPWQSAGHPPMDCFHLSTHPSLSGGSCHKLSAHSGCQTQV